MSYETPPSRLQLQPGPWRLLLDGLHARFPQIGRERWRDRLLRGRVLDLHGRALAVDAPYQVGQQLQYFREVELEAPIPGEVLIIHRDADLLVVDKPHGLPVAPTGRYLHETVLSRLQRDLGLPDLAPLHRIDRDTAGLLLLSSRPDSRDAYAELFRQRRIEKRYQALAPAIPLPSLPCCRRSRLAPGEPFFRMQEVEGDPNSETWIERVEGAGDLALYALRPISGRKHQLRVHMAAMGAPILGDRLYPRWLGPTPDQFEPTLQLLAHSLSFDDPLDGRRRHFTAQRMLVRPENSTAPPPSE